MNAGTEAQEQPLLRLGLAAPPFLLIAGSTLLLLAAPLSWGAADRIDIPAWMPPLAALIVALAGLVLGGYALREVLLRTRQSFEVFPLQLVFGTILFLAAALFEAGLAFRVGDAATYEAAIDDDGEVLITPAAFLAQTLISAAVAFLGVWCAAWVYGKAVTNQRPNRASIRPHDERDGIGELLRERRS